MVQTRTKRFTSYSRPKPSKLNTLLAMRPLFLIREYNQNYAYTQKKLLAALLLENAGHLSFIDYSWKADNFMGNPFSMHEYVSIRWNSFV